jgi:hypothetical protein
MNVANATVLPGESDARQAVRDELARLRHDPVWLARAAPVDQGTVADFLAGNRWPRLSTLAKIDAALGWNPGTIDRIARGTTGAGYLPSTIEASGVAAMLTAVDAELVRATDEWVAATMRAQEAQIAAASADSRRTHLLEDRARLSRLLTEYRANTEGSEP